jgi:hypothetical protein
MIKGRRRMYEAYKVLLRELRFEGPSRKGTQLHGEHRIAAVSLATFHNNAD